MGSNPGLSMILTVVQDFQNQKSSSRTRLQLTRKPHWMVSLSHESNLRKQIHRNHRGSTVLKDKKMWKRFPISINSSLYEFL